MLFRSAADRIELVFETESWDQYRTYCNAGGFVEGIEFFDPMFFRMPPKEAAVIDPQERLFLETAWHTLEDAGYTRSGTLPTSVRKDGIPAIVYNGADSLSISNPIASSSGSIVSKVMFSSAENVIVSAKSESQDGVEVDMGIEPGQRQSRRCYRCGQARHSLLQRTRTQRRTE